MSTSKGHSRTGVQDLVAIVTGGTSGIGLAAVRALLDGGAFVAFTGRRAALGHALEEELNIGCGADGSTKRARTKFILGDVTSASDRERWVSETIAAFGHIDVLFNCAGVVQKGSCLETTEESWDAVMDVNLKSCFAMTKAVLPHFLGRKKGNIINCASDWGVVAAKDYLAYCVSKAGVIQLTKCVALEHARDGVRCNAIAPGDTEVERWHTEGYAVGSGAPVTKEDVELDGADCNPLGRVSSVQEVANAVVFLASRGCESMTGSILTVDGGNTAR